MHKNGLYLVIPGMPEGYAAGADLSSYPGQKSTPQFAGCLLKRALPAPSVGSHVPPIDGGGNAKRAGQIGHIFGVGVGFESPQLMIEMSYVKPCPQCLLRFGQDMNQAHRVRTAGYADDHCLPGRYQAMPPDEIDDF